MNGNQTEAFFEALAEWAETKPEVQDYGTLIYLLSFSVGVRDVDATIDDFKQRIEELIVEHGLSEDLLIMGLVQTVTSLIQRHIMRHGDDILLHQRMHESGHSYPVSESRLEKLTSPGYTTQAQIELDNWNRIVATRFSISKRDAWERERMLEITERLKHTSLKIPQEVREVFADVPLGKLRGKVDFKQMQSMTVDEALEIRRQIEEE